METTSLKELFSIAQKRYQPYINLTEKSYSIEELSTEEIIKEIKKAEIKSLYFRTEKVSFDSEFAENINRLVEAGIREIFILCDEEKSELTTDQLNAFLIQYKVHINFQIAQITAKTIDEIRKDEIGKDNLLGFDDFGRDKHQLIYRNGVILNLLNDADSDKIILDNYANYRSLIIKKHEFVLSEPNYITCNNGSINHRTKEFTKYKKRNANLEVAKNIDLKIELSKETEEENELDLDKDQEDNKFNKKEAQDRVKVLFQSLFLDDYIENVTEDPFFIEFDKKIDKIFRGNKKIQYISNKALYLIVKYYYLFAEGINFNNLPVGLGFKKGILFATEQRLSSMPINEFTLKLDTRDYRITNPLSYSWLTFANKATISLNDIYGSNIAPIIRGMDQHPKILYYKIEDIMLDIPFNQDQSHYYVSETTQQDNYLPSTYRKISSVSKPETVTLFFDLQFFNLSSEDTKHLEDIQKNLNDRNLLEIFTNIVTSNKSGNGEFLLGDKAAVFLEKLFEEILPISRNNKKQSFFIKLLSDYQFKEHNLEEVFEGIDGFYKRFQELLLKLDIEDTATLEGKIITIIKQHLKNKNNFKILLERLILILESTIANGGNLNEQIEYLSDPSSNEILEDPSYYTQSKEFSFNVVHKTSELDKEYLSNKFSEEEIITELSTAYDRFYFEEDIREFDKKRFVPGNLIVESFRYLAQIPSHKRASIDTYSQYIRLLTTDKLPNILNSCRVNQLYADDNLKTIEYFSSEDIAYHYTSVFPGAESTIIYYKGVHYKIETAIIELENLNSNFVSFIVIEQEIYFAYKVRNVQGYLKLNEGYIEEHNAKKLIEIITENDSKQSYFKVITLYEFGNYVYNFIDTTKFLMNSNITLLFTEVEELAENTMPETALQIHYGSDGEYQILLDPSLITDESNENNYEKIILNKSELLISESLDRKIRDFYQNNYGESAIYLTYQDIEGSIFERYSYRSLELQERSIIGRATDLAELKQEYDSMPKYKTKNKCYSLAGIVGNGVNLVNNFTSEQAALNTKLLVLNILGSTGRYYDSQYPDQEFGSYISLFNILLSQFKIYDDFAVGDIITIPQEDFNLKVLFFSPELTSMHTSGEIEEKEKQHKKLITTLTNIFRKNPQFNFAQVVIIGIIEYLELDADIVSNSKKLLQYNSYFVQFLRVLLSSSVSSELNLNELNNRAKLIARNINILTKLGVNGTSQHELLTENGKHPENLIFFAAILAKDEEIDGSKIQRLVRIIESIDIDLKNELISVFAKAKLPFSDGKMFESHFPVLTLDSLQDSEMLKKIIEAAKANQVSYEHAARFNDISLNSMENAKVDLGEIESKYNLQISSEYKYTTLKRALLQDDNFIKNQFRTEQNIDLDLIVAMFEATTKTSSSYKIQIRNIAELLYDKSRTLSTQYLEIEINKRNLDIILAQLSTFSNQDKFLNILSFISHKVLTDLLTLLRNLPQTILENKGFTILSLLESAGTGVINDYFESFKIATDKFLNENINIELSSLYKLIKKLSEASYKSSIVKQVIEYAIENQDYTIITLLSNGNGKADHIEKIIDWICNFPTQQVKYLYQYLGSSVKKWIEIKQIDKIEIIGQIVLKLRGKLTQEHYKRIIENIARNDLSYAKLIQAYLVDYTIEDISMETSINIVMDNLENLEILQSLFADKNLDRFNYNKERVISKISEIVLKNLEQNIDQRAQNILQQSFANILDRSAFYKDFDINQIHERAILLKHTRMLSKDADLSEIAELDLDFLSLAFELLYRQTGKFPRDTQIISHLNSLLRYESIIEEIATGQGKSLITALFASYLWFTGQTVDVVSSSQALASRDLKEFSSFYDAIGIKHSNKIITADSFKGEYQKGGINYSTAADMALFRANREFYSNTHDLSLNADVSLVCDEVDSVLTSEVNYKLATSMISTNQLETRVLFGYILEFVNSDIFRHSNLNRSDDVKNLELYLHYQLLKYNTSYKYPLNAIQMNELMTSTDPLANKLYLLAKALVKADQNKAKLFDRLLDAVVIAESLEEGIDYVVLKEDLDNNKELIKATPIIKDQPSKGTSFGDGVQAFLHLLIEERMPHLAGRFDISPPSSTIFNLSPKNFFDYYRLTGGRIIGLTGTAGSIQEIEEFRTANKMLSFNIPRFEEDLRDIRHEIVQNKEEQIKKLLEIIQSVDVNKPIIVFCENTKAAEEVYNQLLILRDNIQIYAASVLDSGAIENVLNRAGNNGYITITTPMLGRGTDFLTQSQDGFLAVNLCTHITKITLWQIYGRIGRNGQKGEVISLFNKEIFGDDIDNYMNIISLSEKEQRMQSQPLTDVLRFFNQVNHDNPINAITCNEFIRNAWNNLIENNNEGKSYRDLRDDLVAIVRVEYPLGSKKLDDYLQRIDSGIPTPEALNAVQAKSCYQANYVIQQLESKGLLFTQNDFPYSNKNYWPATQYGKSIYINRIEIPSVDQESAYRILYNQIYQVQVIAMSTHAFTITDVEYNLYQDYITLDKGLHDDNLPVNYVYLEGNEIMWRGHGYSHGKIKIGYTAKEGIPQEIYHSVYEKLKHGISSLNLKEKEAIRQHLLAKKKIPTKIFEGEGSGGHLMVDEFKKSFYAYKKRVNSTEVNKISPLIDNFYDLMSLDLDTLEVGKYQAIHIVTKFTSSASHVESLLTDGNFLFWINRGGDTSGSEPGIKVFKIIKGIEFVRDVFKELQKEEKSQAETRAMIYSLLREEDDQNIPQRVLIPMQPQSIGNCGWTQTKGMLKAVAIVGRIGHLTDLPDIESQEWQKAIKDADDIYKDFVNYDIAKRLEAILFTINPEFMPLFLDVEEQEEINSRREILERPITEELLKKIQQVLSEKADKFANTIYEKQVLYVREQIALEIALNSDAGKALKRLDEESIAKEELAQFQANKQNDLEQLNEIYKLIEESSLNYTPMQDQILKQITQYLTLNNYIITRMIDFNDKLDYSIKECLDNSHIIDCVMGKLKQQIIEETEEVCSLGEGTSYFSLFL